jgi:hypothetical protein
MLTTDHPYFEQIIFWFVILLKYAIPFLKLALMWELYKTLKVINRTTVITQLEGDNG